MSSRVSMVRAGMPTSFDAYIDGGYYKTKTLAGKLRSLVWVNGEWKQSSRDPQEIIDAKAKHPDALAAAKAEVEKAVLRAQRQDAQDKARKKLKPILETPQIVLPPALGKVELPEPTPAQRAIIAGDAVQTDKGYGIVLEVDDAGNAWVKLLGSSVRRWIAKEFMTLANTIGDQHD